MTATAPTPAPEVESSEVRQRILDCATALFAAQGFARTSVREISEAAGVTKPALYYWFGSKEGLYTALVDHHMGRWLRETERVMHADLPVRDRLKGWMDLTFSRFEAEGEAMRFVVMAFHQVGQGAPKVDAMRFHVAQVHLLIGLLREGVGCGELRDHDPAAAVYLLLGAVQARIGGAMLLGHALERDTSSLLLDLFLHGVRR